MHYCASNNDIEGVLHLASRGADIYARSEQQPLRPVQLMECNVRSAVVSRIGNWRRRAAFLLFLYQAGLLYLEGTIKSGQYLSLHRSSAMRTLSNFDLTRLITKFL